MPATKSFGVSDALGNGSSADWVICADGRKTLVHLTLGNTERYDTWLRFLRNLVGCGLAVPVTGTSDGAPGLLRAIESV